MSTRPISLNDTADTKRKILQSIASQYDVHNYNGLIMNRSCTFLHRLQCNTDLGWDHKLSAELLKEWRNITKQTNAAPVIKVKRSVGGRNNPYRLIAFTDASKLMYGVVLYLQNLKTKDFPFCMQRIE